MKRHIRAIMLPMMIGLLTIPLHAKTVENRIFPSYTGLSATVTAPNVCVRSYPSQYTKVVGSANSVPIHIVGQNTDWYKVALGNGQTGWIAKDYVKTSLDELVPYSKILGEEVVEYGKLFIGTPYVWGGNDLTSGVDCSGLTKEVYETFDINISRLSYTQVDDGESIPKGDLLPGDLVFFDTSGENNGNISHVGIYAGEDKFLHADSTHGVMISSLSSAYYTKNYVASSRIIN